MKYAFDPSKPHIEPKIPYMDFRGETDFSGGVWPGLNVKTDEDTRIRVFCTQLMDDVVHNITSKNDFMYHVSLFYKMGDKLIERFPNRSAELFEASLVFWSRVQEKIKGLKV